MTSGERNETAGRLRAAVTAGRYDEAASLLADYRRLVDAARNAEAAQAAVALFDELRRAVLVERAGLAARLAETLERPRYVASRAPAHTWEMEG